VISEGNKTEELPFVSKLFHETAQELGIRVLGADEQP
jgi:hydrogenase maturation factor